MAGMKALDPRVTFAELQQWPDDGRRYELYDGEVIVVPMPLPRHQRVALNLSEILREYERATGGLVFGSPIDIVFSAHTVLQPDLTFFTAARKHLLDMMEATRVPPDLAVEVLSRSTETRDRGRKLELYARFGVPEYWIVNPVANTLEIHCLDSNHHYVLAGSLGSAESAASSTLPGLSIPGARVFAD
jgi:Uma2 family endonuclease